MRIEQDRAARQAFGAVIRGLRRSAGLSQEDFGDLAGLHRTYISMMERGIKTPTIVTLVDIATAAGMATADLMALFDREFATLRAGTTESVADDAVLPVKGEGAARRSRN